MADAETVRKWEELRQEVEMWERAMLTFASEIGPGPVFQRADQAPWWFFEGFKFDPSRPEPRANLIQSAIIWELAFEAIRKNELSETSTTLLAIKESGILQTILEEQAEQLERAAKNIRIKSASLVRKGV